MFVAVGLRNAAGRGGWRIFHMRPWDDNSGTHQVTPLGFVPADEAGETWTKLRKHLPGLTHVETLEVTPEELSNAQAQTETPEHMRRVADALEGN